ncbi:MAG TPA: hypothetical protein VGI16_12530 [Candidatus Acidoferrum sp.]|jgi:hypothetical protein
MLPKHLRIGLCLLGSIVMLSCGSKRAPERLTVVAPEDFSGEIVIKACDPAASDDHIALDAAGHGSTSICSATGQLKLVVIRGTQSTELQAYPIKTGDGIVVEVRAELK